MVLFALGVALVLGGFWLKAFPSVEALLVAFVPWTAGGALIGAATILLLLWLLWFGG